jgi:hypothetical protein
MDPLAAYIQTIYRSNRSRFIVDIAKTAADLNTQVFIPDHRMIVRAIETVVKVPHTTTVNSQRTHIEVSVIGK